jgi:phosphoribosylanthranilate isomerase
MVKIKICGITNLEDALMVAGAGADALGFVFVPGSPRYIDPCEAAEIRRHLPPFLSVVGVFANAPLREVGRVAEDCQLSAIQLHGEESPDYCSSLEKPVIKAFRLKDSNSLEDMGHYEVGALLLDTFSPGLLGGTGRAFDWRLAREAKKYGRVILSGGLNPQNVAEAIYTARPYAVDVSSGVEERAGKKEEGKVRRFIEEVARTEIG